MQNYESESLTVSVETAGKILGISRGLTYQMVREGRIRALRFGRCIRVSRFELERLLGKVEEDQKYEASEIPLEATRNSHS